MSSIKILFYQIHAIFMILLICSNFNDVWANNFISRGHYVIDLSQKLEWLTCPVGMIWENKTCVGIPVKLKFFWNELEGSSHCYGRIFIFFEGKYAVCNH